MSVSAKPAPRRTPGKIRRFFRRFHVTPNVYFRLKIACVAAVAVYTTIPMPKRRTLAEVEAEEASKA